MPITLKRIADSEKDILSMNRNFDDISLALADRSGTFSSVGIAYGVTVSANTNSALLIDVEDNKNIYTLNLMPVIPRVNVFIDAPDTAYRWPDGAALSATQINKILVSCFTAQGVVNGTDTTKAQFFVVIHNTDSSDHTYYAFMDGFYVPAPETGVANRS